MGHLAEAVDTSGNTVPESPLERKRDGIAKCVEDYLVMLHFYTSSAGFERLKKGPIRNLIHGAYRDY